MKYSLRIILILLTTASFGQEIEKITFTTQQDDEPPTKEGRPKYTVEFLGQQSGDFVAVDFYKDKERKKLKNNVWIERERAEKIDEWKKADKRTFSQTDLGLNINDLRQQNGYKLNFEVPIDLTVDVDSFRFCKPYDHLARISLGGAKYIVTLMYKSGQKQEFAFDSNFEDVDFNLQAYILCYILLVDKIPDEVPSYNFFSKGKFLNVIWYYQKTVECEGFYYKEFTDKNPTMTAKDKRMMTGWDFVEYLKERTTKK